MSHETESGAWPEATVTSRHGSSTSAHIDQSVNRTMPWIALLAILSTAALVVSLSGVVVMSYMTKTAKEREDEKYKILWDKYQLVERECRVAQDDVTNYVKRGDKYKLR